MQQHLRVLLVDDGSPHIPLLDAELMRLGVQVLGVLDSAVDLARHRGRSDCLGGRFAPATRMVRGKPRCAA